MYKRIKEKLKNILIRERIVPVEITKFQGNLLEGQTALVTGGNSGIGRSIAKKMIESGCKVIISGSNEDKLKKTAREINAEYVVIDIVNVSEIKNKLQKLTDTIPVNILVNCAGILGSEKFGEITEAGWDSIINVNLRGLYFFSQFIANYMIAQNIHGHILNISSSSSLRPSWTPYEVSKRAVDGITQGFAHKLIPYGIVVNGLAPGPTASPMLQFDKQDKINLKWSPNPSGRVSTVDEIANWAIFLTSHLGDGIVGDTVFITGGAGTVCIDK